MNYDIIKLLKIKYELIDENKSFECYDNSETHIVELFLKDDKLRVCKQCGITEDISIISSRIIPIRHASSAENNVVVNVHRRVYKCGSCGYVFLQDSPITEENRTISVNKDFLILEDLKDTTNTFKKVAEKYKVSSTYVSNLFDRKVDVRRGYMPQVLCIDEIYSRKLSEYHYLCVLYSPQKRAIIDILESRRKDFLIDYFAHITSKEKQNIQYVAIDMYENYRNIIKSCLPSADICVDSFHVIKQLNNCFNKIRIRVMKSYERLKKEGHEYYWLLKKFWKFLLMNLDNLPVDYVYKTRTGMELTKYKIVEEILNLDEELKETYYLKEDYREFNLTTDNPEQAIEPLNELILKFKRSKIKEYILFWKMLQNWKNEILNSFNRVNGYRISNGPIEKANSEIRKLLKVSYGYSNFVRFRNRTMYSINKTEPILGVKKTTLNNRKGKPRGHYKNNK